MFVLEDNSINEKTGRKTGVRLVISCLLMLGFLLAFFGLYYTIPGYWMIIVTAIIAEIVLIICQRNKTTSLISVIGVVAICVVLLVINFAGFTRSLIYLMNQLITAWNNQFEQFHTLFALDSCSDMDRLFFWIILMLVGSVILSRLIYGYFRIATTLISIGLLFASIMLNLNLGVWAVVVMIIGWFSFWMLETIGYQSIGKILIMGLILILCSAGLMFETNGYAGIQSVADLKKNIIDTVDQVRYGEDTLPQGDLTKANTMVGDDSDTLRLEFQEAQEMYLRGFVGSEYQGNAWEEASGAIYAADETSGMLDWLQSQGFESSFQYAAYRKAADSEEVSANSVTVDNVGAYRRYIYAPYEIDSADVGVGEEEYDWQLQSGALFGANDYSYKIMQSEMPTELIVAEPISGDSEGQQQYVDAENVYRTFVYENYLEVSDEEKALLEEQIYNNEDWSEANVYQLTSQIRIALQGLVTYSEQPFEYTGNEDFVNWFLTKSKQGNSAYYATVATLAYRTMGIPARYVEGYYMSDGTATSLNNDEQKTAELTQKDAHAWTEVYMDGIGWMPVEVVPGFYFADYTTQQVLGIPQSSVTIMDDENQEELQGSTTDQLEKQKEEKKEPETVVQKTIRVLGIVLLALMVLALLFLLIQLQQKIRMANFRKRIEKGDSKTIGNMLYDRMCQIFHMDKVPGDIWFPYESSDAVSDSYEGISTDDYKRFLSLIQKEKFGDNELQASEVKTLKAFIERLTRESYGNAKPGKRLLMKYWYCMHE